MLLLSHPPAHRILHIPGRPNTPPPPSSSSEQPEQPALEDLLALDPPQDSGLIVCQLTAQLDPLESPLQLAIQLPLQPGTPAAPAQAGASSSSGSGSSRQHQEAGANNSSNGSSSGSGRLEPPATAAGASSSSSSNSNRTAAGAARGQDSQEQQLMPIGSPVRHLPPLTLHLVFPVTYPSHEPPDVQVTGSWLGPQQQQQLAAALLASWEEEALGAPVCYQWLEWLRSNALQHLGIGGTVVIPVSLQDIEEQEAAEAASRAGAAGPSSGPAASAAAAGPRAPQELLAAYMARCEQVALQVLSHDRAQEQAAFEASNWPCAICLDQVPGSKCIQVAPCCHVFCRACLASYCDSLVGEGAVQQLRCPDPSCRSSLLPDQVRQLLTPEQFAR